MQEVVSQFVEQSDLDPHGTGLVEAQRRRVDAARRPGAAALRAEHRGEAAFHAQSAAGIAICPAPGTDESLIRTIEAWGIPLVVMIRSLADMSRSSAPNMKGY